MEKILKFRPPRVAIGLMIVSAALSHLSPDRTVLHFPYKFIGTIFAAGGFIIMMGAWLTFRKKRTAVCHTGEASVLVTNGIYKRTRNPMYMGMLLMLTGAAFLIGDVVVFIAPAIFFIISDKIYIPYEEAKLSTAFGIGYEDYLTRTRRWI